MYIAQGRVCYQSVSFFIHPGLVYWDLTLAIFPVEDRYNVSVLGQDEGYTVKYNPLPKGVPEGKAQGNS